MAQNYNQYPQQYGQQPPQQQQPPPPVQTQNLAQQPPRPFSPQSYSQSPNAMSPTMGSGIPPAKRPRLSPNPTSPAPYQSPFAAPPYPMSPYASSPQAPGYLSLPQSPANTQPPPFHQPQPYQHPNHMAQPPHQQQQPQQPPPSSMPPPKVPYSKATDNAELEKANARDLDVNNISDVLTGSGIDLRAEEDNLLHSYGNRSGYGTSFNSQASGSTLSPHGSFNNWNQQASHGAFQGTGPLSQSMTQEQQEAEFLRKHEQAARILNESAQQCLTDPFCDANVLRHRMARRAYENGIQVNVDGLFDKIPDKTPRDVTRTAQSGANGEQIVGLEAASLLNQNAPLVEILSLLSLAAEERIRTIVEDSFALSQGRQNTSHGIVPPQMVDIAVKEADAEQKTAAPANVTRTPWEAPESAASPTATASKGEPMQAAFSPGYMLTVSGLPNAARLPTPPSEAPLTPQPTYQNVNHIANVLKRRVREDEQFEKERLRKRQQRQQGKSAAAAEAAEAAPLPIPEKITKKQRDAMNKAGQTEDVLHRKANETAALALGGGRKKKYSWMTGGGGGGGGGGGSGASGASTPARQAPGTGGSGAVTPAAATVEVGMRAKKRNYGTNIENSEIGEKIQVRDLIHVLENDGREKKTLALILARLKNTEKDEARAVEYDRRLPAGVAGVR